MDGAKKLGNANKKLRKKKTIVAFNIYNCEKITRRKITFKYNQTIINYNIGFLNTIKQ